MLPKPCPALIPRIPSRFSTTLAVLLPALLLFGGCQSHPSPTVTRSTKVVPAPPAKKPAVAPAPVKAPAAAEALLVVLSDSSSAYGRLVEIIRTRSDRETTILSLDTPLPGEHSLASQLQASQGPVIAIGIEAANFLAAQASQRDIVFALVFNHRDHRLLAQGMIGISMLPPPEQVLRLFKAISPQVTTLVLPVSPDLASYAALARTEASKLGLSLDTPEIGNDKELLLLTRKLDPAIRGLWLLPDNRVVSKDSLQQIMAGSVKNGRQTIVFSPTLFPLGGLLSAEYDEEATVVTILEAITASAEHRRKLRGQLLRPRASRLTLNPGMVETLGLTVPPQFRPLLQVDR